jgi:aminoglycoside phosphotransferase (APT) family kinase protein
MSGKDAFVATDGDRKLFLMCNVNAPVLRRLADLHVAPPLVESGSWQGQPYVVQEYVEGAYPDREWIGRHLRALVLLIARYHADEPLRRMVAPRPEPSYRAHVEQTLLALEHGLACVRSRALHSAQAVAAISELRRQAGHFPAVPLVPTHGDPNTKNILVAGSQIWLIDWDDIQLSDPMRDLGVLLWWYVARDRWQEVLHVAGLSPADAVLPRLYWWSACASFRVALWHGARAHDEDGARAFLDDCVAALDGRANPRG